MHTRQRTRISGGTLTRQAARAAGACAEGARAAGARAEGAWPRKRPREGRESRVPCGGRWRDRRADAQHRPRCIPHSNPRVRSCEGEGRSKTVVSSDPGGWREAPAAEPLGAWHV